MKLVVHFTDEYPDALPLLSLRVLEGSLDDGELRALLDDLRQEVIRVYFVYAIWLTVLL
jgi:hypothetical protein